MEVNWACRMISQVDIRTKNDCRDIEISYTTPRFSPDHQPVGPERDLNIGYRPRRQKLSELPFLLPSDPVEPKVSADGALPSGQTSKQQLLTASEASDAPYIVHD